MAYIYKIINDINNKIYIGKTLKTIEERFKEHCKDYKRREEEKRPLYNAMNKYGIEHFKIELVEECPENEVNEKEKYWIEYYGSFKNGYNATIGGDGKAYIDRELVIKTYKEIQNISKTAKILKINEGYLSRILKENNVKIKTRKEIAEKQQGKPIIMLDTKDNVLKSFSTLSNAARFIKPNNVNDETYIHGVSSHIRDVANGKRKTAYQYKWKWL